MPWPYDDAASAAATSDMERQMRAYAWETSPLGPVGGWSQSLKNAVRTLLDMRLPAYLAWGEHFTQFFNEAFVPILGHKRAGALGNDARITWSEIWPTIGPMWDRVLGGEPTGAESFALTKLELETIDLNEVVRAAVEQARPHIEAKSHTLSVKRAARPVAVAGDRTRLVQVLVNLLNNAAKYTPAGGAIALRLEAGKKQARLSVTDNGSGIDPQLLPHVFDLFTQGERAPDRSQGGLGIGLALVKSIVQMHAGQVEAHSEGPNTGASVSVLLPLAEAGQLHAPGRIRHASGAGGPRMLTIVDDNADAAQSLAVLLRAQGHTVTVFEDAVRTLASTELHGTEAFILDIGLPDITGYELARRLRRDHPQATFIALTGYGQARDRDLSKQAGFDHHLVKPVEIRALSDILAQLRAPDAGQASGGAGVAEPVVSVEMTGQFE